ncbi:MAG TPA: thiamine phosphate synthase, partial [Pseudomonas sp.]|nr:thiamine phosphate synthase [Pseudomonas sp.]
MTSASPAPRGVYLITPDEPDTAHLLARTAPLLAAGATWLQYRNKTANDALRQEQAT